ncbi:hypothetical protein MPH_02826 [Macrophomina phaseolina MS6]|uniref:Uncharacterized protein n=1 Tax=Macrophomina phaseolina (strain MS6) TaxID=1126212 RepID=K2SBX7_MACPH|nr:hypothetical protein MPH_02826 [Macrophomina phaseolina MS6]
MFQARSKLPLEGSAKFIMAPKCRFGLGRVLTVLVLPAIAAAAPNVTVAAGCQEANSAPVCTTQPLITSRSGTRSKQRSFPPAASSRPAPKMSLRSYIPWSKHPAVLQSGLAAILASAMTRTLMAASPSTCARSALQTSQPIALGFDLVPAILWSPPTRPWSLTI